MKHKGFDLLEVDRDFLAAGCDGRLFFFFRFLRADEELELELESESESEEARLRVPLECAPPASAARPQPLCGWRATVVVHFVAHALDHVVDEVALAPRAEGLAQLLGLEAERVLQSREAQSVCSEHRVVTCGAGARGDACNVIFGGGGRAVELDAAMLVTSVVREVGAGDHRPTPSHLVEVLPKEAELVGGVTAAVVLVTPSISH